MHDGRAKKLNAASSVKLSSGPQTKSITIHVANDGSHTDSFGVYVDIVPPGGVTNPYGCAPTGRIINTVVTLAAGAQTTITVNPTFSCANVAGAVGQTYTIEAAVDVHANDGSACPVFQIQSMACFNALADDDDDDADNRVTKNAPKVK